MFSSPTTVPREACRQPRTLEWEGLAWGTDHRPPLAMGLGKIANIEVKRTRLYRYFAGSIA
jgi:hypothetical protein